MENRTDALDIQGRLDNGCRASHIKPRVNQMIIASHAISYNLSRLIAEITSLWRKLAYQDGTEIDRRHTCFYHSSVVVVNRSCVNRKVSPSIGLSREMKRSVLELREVLEEYGEEGYKVDCCRFAGTLPMLS
jgi:hypothetical protein